MVKSEEDLKNNNNKNKQTMPWKKLKKKTFWHELSGEPKGVGKGKSCDYYTILMGKILY